MVRTGMTVWDLHRDYEKIHDVFQQYDKNREADAENVFENIDAETVADLLEGYETLIQEVLSSTSVRATLR